MPDDLTDRPGALLAYLPEIYREDDFLGQYLSFFEKVLLRRPDAEIKGVPNVAPPKEPGLEQKIEGIAAYFDPMRAPAEFLGWLSGWVALSLRTNLDELRQRDFIKNAVRLYHMRGTKRGIEELVSIYTRLGVSITESAVPFRVEHKTGSRVETDTMLEGGAPFVFRVLINLRETTDVAEVKRQHEVVTAILNMEKPAHTQFVLEEETLAMQIEDHSRVEVDTLLG
ncbi:MAG: phage tail protein [Acidobacteria bacterium]|nr:phage tail protein [Acidobacteriota bacterium]